MRRREWGSYGGKIQEVPPNAKIGGGKRQKSQSCHKVKGERQSHAARSPLENTAPQKIHPSHQNTYS